MMRYVKDLIEENIQLFRDKDLKSIYMEGYARALTTQEMRELRGVVDKIFDTNSTQLLNDLLYETVDINLKFVKAKNKDIPEDNWHIADVYLVQFLRRYLNNTFGYVEHDAVSFVYANQANLGITLVPVRDDGQAGIENYKIIFD